MKFSVEYDLEYIANSPPPEYGGFKPQVVLIAKDALELIHRLKSEVKKSMLKYLEETHSKSAGPAN